jgi:nicotinamide mononucleotide transporter
MHDSLIALASAFCGITYTILAGKGNPLCYLIGLTGSAFYVYLSFINHLWGNLLLYGFYFVPMQILGFFRWNKNLKKDKYEIIKTRLEKKENILLFSAAGVISFIFVLVLFCFGDANPVMDGLTTVFSVLGMYLTVRRAIEQWYVWAGVNFLSLVMWLIVAVQGERVYSTVLMWLVYFILAIYFYKNWKKELA